jgi:Tfp pilus assembly protein PilX
MIAFCRKKTSSAERGVALIMAMLVLLLVTAVGMGMIIMSNTETNISANFKDEQTAYFAAKGGIEEVRDRLRAGATNSVNLPVTLANTLPGAVGGILYVLNPLGTETVAPWLTTGTNYPDDQIGKELNCSTGTPPVGIWWTTPQSASTSYATSPTLQWKWVRIMAKVNKSDTTCTNVTSVDGNVNNNRVCWTGTHEIATAAASCNAAGASYQPVYELTSLAVTSGGSRRMMQYEVSQNSFPTIPGAFVFDGSAPSFNPPNSAAFTVSGTDPLTHPGAGTYGSINGVACPVPVNQPALGSFDNPATSTLVAAMTGPPDRSGQYTSGGYGVPAVSNMYSTLSTDSINLTTVDGLRQFASMITTAAGPNVYANGVTPTNMGTPTSPVVNVVNGDLSVSGSGAGILLVTGVLTLNGAFSWDGLVLAIGEGAIVKNGGGSAVVNGSMFAANLTTGNPGTSGPGAYPAAGYGTAIALGSNNPPGKPFFGWSGGGSCTVQYDSCWVQAVTQSLPYHLITQRELSY